MLMISANKYSHKPYVGKLWRSQETFRERNVKTYLLQAEAIISIKWKFREVQEK